MACSGCFGSQLGANGSPRPGVPAGDSGRTPRFSLEPSEERAGALPVLRDGFDFEAFADRFGLLDKLVAAIVFVVVFKLLT